MFKTGNVVFKINEECEFDKDYPEHALNQALNNIFKVNSSTFLQLDNNLNLSNTYIIELEKPKTIADIVGEIEVNMYSNSNAAIRVTEEYLSAIYTTSYYDGTINQYLRGNEEYDNSIMFTNGYSSNAIERTIKYKVTEADVQDFLKLYVNYSKDPNTGEITLYFNYNNLFTSPYLYRRENGTFSTIFKDNTYKKIKPGENDVLDVVIQIKYYNYVGEICGIKDIPVLSYRIYNVSDDKPKFVIKNTWIISPSNVEYVASTPLNEINGALFFIPNDSKNLTNTSQLDLINDNYTINRDVIVYATGYLTADGTTIKSASFDLIYEFSNSDIEFMESMSFGAGFSRRNQFIHVVTTYTNNNTFTLAFKIKKGTFVNENGNYNIPIDATNCSAIAMNDLKIKNIIINTATITVKFFGNSNDVVNYNQYLGKDDNSGFIKSHDDKLIQIFRNKSITISVTGDNN